MKPHLVLSAYLSTKVKVTLTILCSALYAYLASTTSIFSATSFSSSPSVMESAEYHSHVYANSDAHAAAGQALASSVTRQESAFVIPPHPSTLTFSYLDMDFDFMKNPIPSSRNNVMTDDDLLCVPRHLHLSLGNETRDDKTSMTVSFSIPFQKNNTMDTATTLPCYPNDLSIVLEYGTLQDEKDSILHVLDNTIDVSSLLEGGQTILNQYNMTSPLTFQPYISDWIYHIPLQDLEGSTKYWYQIVVFEKNHDDNSVSMDIDNPMDLEQEEMEEEHDDQDRIVHFLNPTQSSTTTTSIKRERYQRATSTLRGGQEKDDTRTIERTTTAAVLGKSPKLFFTTAQTYASAPTQPTKLAIVGDLGQTYNSSITMLNMLHETRLNRNDGETPATAILCAGDMSYANSIQSEWDNWFDLIEPLLSQTPLMVAAGNHEIECDVETHLPFLAYENRFHMPNRLGPAIIGPADDSYFFNHTVDPWDTCATPSVFLGSYDYGNAFYSFTHGLVKVLVLSSYSDTSVGSIQYNWLEKELDSIDRSKTPWVIVIMHTQFYTTFLAHNDELQTTIMREAMEPLFLKYKVNLVFSGHDHGYMRTKSMYNGTVDESGKSPVYLIVGEGGNREHHVNSFLNDTAEDWIGVRDKTVYGFGTLEVINRSIARWKWIMDGLSDNGTSFTDDFIFTNQFV